MKNRVFIILAILFLASTVPIAGQTKEITKNSDAQTPLRDLQQLWFESQARSDGKDAVFYIKGSAYAYIQGTRPQKLFDVEGYNIRRLVETPEKDGYFIATREIVFYEDPTTGEILSEWQNPFTKEKNEVFHITNDPVNFRYRIKDKKYVAVSVDGKREFGEKEAPEMWNNHFVWHADIFPFYKLPEMSNSYTAGELFDFYVPQNELYKTGAPEVMISWSRVSPWLPWMKMGEQAGAMVIHARSVRYESWQSLPEKIKNTVHRKYPLYESAPDKVDPNKPNETSWTVYYDEMRKRQQK